MTKEVPFSSRDLFVAEAIGTFILVFFGIGAVHAAVAYGAQQGLWQVAVAWGLAVSLAIYCVGSISGAHINPAITVSMWLWNGFEGRKVGLYIAAQLTGAFLAAFLLFALFSSSLSAVEEAFGVERGLPGSEITASCYGEFYPNPGALTKKPYSIEEHEALKARVPHGIAFLAEFIGTALLAFAVFALSNERNHGAPKANIAPVFIGLTVSLIISVLAPLTQACLNPARDFGPRLLSALAGWGHVALPLGSDWGWLTVYIVAPVLGAAFGGVLFTKIVSPIFAKLPDE